MNRDDEDLEEILRVLNKGRRKFFYTDATSEDEIEYTGKNRLMAYRDHEGENYPRLSGYVSPRLENNELYWWIDGYMRGTEEL
jgi:hypothetical protein